MKRSLSDDQISEHLNILCVVLLIVVIVIVSHNAVPHIEAGAVDTKEQSAAKHSVFPGEGQSIPAPRNQGGHGREGDNGCEEGSPPGLGLPYTEALMVVV